MLFANVAKKLAILKKWFILKVSYHYFIRGNCMKKMLVVAAFIGMAASLFVGCKKKAAETVSADWKPDGTVTMIVAYKAGSGTDNTARVLTSFAEKYVGQTLVIDNKEGGSGSIGWTALAKAKPDGLTLGFINLPTFCSNIIDGPRKVEGFDKWKQSFQPHRCAIARSFGRF